MVPVNAHHFVLSSFAQDVEFEKMKDFEISNHSFFMKKLI
jgi:hypothetical protein